MKDRKEYFKKYYLENKEKRKKYYEDNKEKIIKRCTEYAKQNIIASRKYKNKSKHSKKEIAREYVRNIKINCKCGQNNYMSLDFHHKDVKDKKYSINKLISHGYKLETIKNEIDKCIIICANCHRKEHFPNNPKPINNEKARYVADIKTKSKCLLCSENYWACLDFHHINPEDKIDSISNITRNNKYSLYDLKSEISKCQILCVNCHRQTYEV